MHYSVDDDDYDDDERCAVCAWTVEPKSEIINQSINQCFCRGLKWYRLKRVNMQTTRSPPPAYGDTIDLRPIRSATSEHPPRYSIVELQPVTSTPSALPQQRHQQQQEQQQVVVSVYWKLYSKLTLDIIIRPGNGSPSATNVVLVVLVVISTKAFSFHNRSSSNFSCRLVTTSSTIALCPIFKGAGKLRILSVFFITTVPD